ncbi:MAG: hypothetical protein JWM59_4355 [Verrucomicrobiales bacterium]|nr:hypothetical protein [Verrucomicrobiales bacterium]
MAEKGTVLTIEERRARRAARREKQREANAGRALKMHAVRTAAGSTLETDPEVPPDFNIGCSGWFYWDWKGKFYPQAMPTQQWFYHYASHFSTVELNAPFYSWPTVNAVKTWLRQAGGRNLLYTVKVCELITHVKRFKGTKTLIRDFGFIGDLLGKHMGCFLFQLPPSHDYTPARLKAILSQLDPGRRNVVEFRHASWWNAKVYDAFRKTGTIFCSCSAPRLPDELIATTEEVYLRFHGPVKWYRHDYSTPELKVWRDRIQQSGANRVWAYFNNDWDAFAIKNAGEFRALLKQVQD